MRAHRAVWVSTEIHHFHDRDSDWGIAPGDPCGDETVLGPLGFRQPCLAQIVLFAFEFHKALAAGLGVSEGRGTGLGRCFIAVPIGDQVDYLVGRKGLPRRRGVGYQVSA